MPPIVTRRAMCSLLAGSISALLANSHTRAQATTVSPVSTDSTDQAAWDTLRSGGHVMLIRHTRAPGTFDPPSFTLGDCSTQRNLSEEGRAQALRLGELVRAMGVAVDQVQSSQWCRCVDTAKLAFGTNLVKTYAPLNSPTQLTAAQRQANTQTLRKDIQAFSAKKSKAPANRVFVTHMFNIQDITGESVMEGEILVVKGDASGVRMVGRIAPATATAALTWGRELPLIN